MNNGWVSFICGHSLEIVVSAHPDISNWNKTSDNVVLDNSKKKGKKRGSHGWNAFHYRSV